MRDRLTSWLELTGTPLAIREGIMLATHEAAANAMKHGWPDSPVTVTASQNEGGGFVVEVTSRGAWKEPEPGHDGRGLAMMAELMSDVAIEPITNVRMRSEAGRGTGKVDL